MFSLIVSTALLLAVLLGGTLPTAAQSPEPPCPAKSLPGSPLPPDGGPRRAPDGAWYVPAAPAPPQGPSTSVSPQDTGGPDDFGYSWDDSVALNWIDATGGNDTGMSGDSWNQAAGPISLPFSFKYYENTYNQVYIAAAGYLAFTEASYWDAQMPIPSPEEPNNVIAPYWTPTYIGASGWVRYLSGGTAPNRYLVVEWHDVKGGPPGDAIGEDDTYRFEVILYENGDIVFQYLAMTFNDSAWCGDIGIEDSEGLDGLSYGDFCGQAPSHKAVRFYRPPLSARLSIRPLYQGRFTHEGETVTFQLPIRNTGDLGSDTYDLFVSSPWSVGLYAADGTTPLTDTDFDGTADTGAMAQGSTTTIVVKVTTPGTANVGDDNSAAITVHSSLDTGKSKTPTLRTAIPAPFAQVYQDVADGAMSLYLVQPAAQAMRKATSDGHRGYDMAVAEMPDSFAYFWNDSGWTGSVGTYEIEYTLLDRYGQTVRGVSELTNHSAATVDTFDYDPAIAVAPNGRIGVVWYRYLSNPYDYTRNYNIYYAILDVSGNVVVPPTNLTSNPIWGYGSWPVNVPLFVEPRIAATTDNRFVLAWERRENTIDGRVEDIYYTIRDTGGGIVKPITRFTSDTPGSDEGYYYPSLAQLSVNRLLFVWQRSSDENIYYAVLDSAGNMVSAQTSTGASGWGPDAVQLSSGNTVIAWSGSVRFVVLDNAYNLIAGPTALINPAAVTGDADVSVAADNTGHAVLTWMDSGSPYRRNLYYALVDGNGNVLTDPMIFRTSQATEPYPYIFTSYEGYGNTSYSWAPPSDVDGVAAFSASLSSGPPGGNAAVRLHYANYGATTATNVVLTVTLDSNLTYMSDTSGVVPTVSGNDVIWSLPDLDLLDREDFTLYVQVPSGAAYGTRYPVTLTLASDGPEANDTDNTDSAEVMVTRQVFLPLVSRGY
jgi:hypothetical protein